MYFTLKSGKFWSLLFCNHLSSLSKSGFKFTFQGFIFSQQKIFRYRLCCTFFRQFKQLATAAQFVNDINVSCWWWSLYNETCIFYFMFFILNTCHIFIGVSLYHLTDIIQLYSTCHWCFKPCNKQSFGESGIVYHIMYVVNMFTQWMPVIFDKYTAY